MKKRGVSIAVKMVALLLVIFVFEGMLIGYNVIHGDVLEYMQTNERNIFHERVVNRKNYLEEKMRVRWADIEDSTTKINNMTQKLVDAGSISLDSLDKSSESSMPLLKETSDVLISLVRSNGVTGAFLVLNTENLEEKKQEGLYEDKPGLYLHDYDPASRAWERNQDLLWSYAPAEFIRQQEFSTDEGWKTKFNFSQCGDYLPYLYEPYQAAKNTENVKERDILDFGYWGYTGINDCAQKEAITYSVPLVLEDGTVYGVLGIDLMSEYVKKLLPYLELIDDNKDGSYFIGIQKGDESTAENVLLSGNTYMSAFSQGGETVFSKKDGQIYIDSQSEQLCAEITYLELYNESSPFYEQKWVLAGIAREEDLFQFTDRLLKMFSWVAVLAVAIGGLGGVIGIIYISRPVLKLVHEVEAIKLTKPFTLTQTGILEIDKLSNALVQQSIRLNQVMNKFSNIIHMADIPLAAFEVNRKDKTVFITDKFFEIFGLPPKDSTELWMEDFWQIFQELEVYKESEGEVTLYQIPGKHPGEYRFVRTMVKDSENYYIGFVEDVTKQTLDLKRMEYERNHDVLTGLNNRRAFFERLRVLFENPKQLKTAAFVMIDLDNLKHINDTFGHGCGDQYIQTAAECLKRGVPQSAVVCRLAGDEFCIFFYGCSGKEEIRHYIERLQVRLKHTTIRLQENQEYSICISGGIAWYPEDGRSCEELLERADKAMYTVKKAEKGQFKEYEKRTDNEIQRDHIDCR